MYLPMEIVAATEMLDTVEMNSLSMIPSEAQVRQAISMLCKRKEKDTNKYVYVKFPFGMMDYNGLKTIQAYHDGVQHKRKIREEKKWLHDVNKLSSEVGVDLPEIKRYFEEHIWTSKQHAPIQSLVGDRWLSNYDIDAIFDLINKKYDNTIAFVCKPSQFMYGLQEKIDETIKNKTNITKIFIALNVGCDKGEIFVSDEKRSGIHWSLLIIDVSTNTAYYGDSLAWSLPSNLISAVESSLKIILSELEIDIRKCLQNIIVLQKSGVPINGRTPFYPLQTCSNMCGVIVVCMSAILYESWGSWVTCTNQTVLPLISKPSVNSRQLRLMVMSWILTSDINVDKFSPKTQLPNDPDVNAIIVSDADDAITEPSDSCTIESAKGADFCTLDPTRVLTVVL